MDSELLEVLELFFIFPSVHMSTKQFGFSFSNDAETHYQQPLHWGLSPIWFLAYWPTAVS